MERRYGMKGVILYTLRKSVPRKPDIGSLLDSPLNICSNTKNIFTNLMPFYYKKLTFFSPIVIVNLQMWQIRLKAALDRHATRKLTKTRDIQQFGKVWKRQPRVGRKTEMQRKKAQYM